MADTIEVVIKRKFKVNIVTKTFPTTVYTLSPGIYELEQIKNPHTSYIIHLTYRSEDWLVLEGTKIGAAITYWKLHRDHRVTDKFIVD